MKRSAIVICVAVFLVLGFAAQGYCWGSMAHAYITDRLNKPDGQRNLNEIYGALVPDMFNYSFSIPVEVQTVLHYEFLKIWEEAKTGMERGLAYGFVSHNEEWGADMTAHISGITLGFEDGYVITKAELLGMIAPLPPELGVPPEVAAEIYHILLENGLDILIPRLDPTIGYKVSSAAVKRDSRFPDLLAEAYAEDLSYFFGTEEIAAQVLKFGESLFRNDMALFGQIFLTTEPEIIQMVAVYVAGFAEDYLALYGVELPPWMDPVEVVKGYLTLSMWLCEPDYETELEATINYLDGKLAEEGIGNRRYFAW